jgi:hypothetical protein
MGGVQRNSVSATESDSVGVKIVAPALGSGGQDLGEPRGARLNLQGQQAGSGKIPRTAFPADSPLSENRFEVEYATGVPLQHFVPL